MGSAQLRWVELSCIVIIAAVSAIREQSMSALLLQIKNVCFLIALCILFQFACLSVPGSANNVHSEIQLDSWCS